MGWGQEQEHPCGSNGCTVWFSSRWDVWEQGHHCGSNGCTAWFSGRWDVWDQGWFPALCSGEHTALPGQHMGRGASKPWHVFTDCQPHLPGWWPLVSKVWAEQGWDGSCLAHGNLLNQLEVLPAGGWHIAHTCPGSSATGLPCNSAHTAPAVRQLFPVPAQLCDSLGRAPQSFADCLDHVPLGKEYLGQTPEVGFSWYHHEALLSPVQQSCAPMRVVPQPGELLLSSQVPPG